MYKEKASWGENGAIVDAHKATWLIQSVNSDDSHVGDYHTVIVYLSVSHNYSQSPINDVHSKNFTQSQAFDA